MTDASWKTMLLQAAEVASLSGAGPAATLMNQSALGIRGSAGPPAWLGGWVITVVLVAVPPGPAVTWFRVNAGG